MKKRYTSDCILEYKNGSNNFVVLIERNNFPFGYAIAGGFRDLIKEYEHLQGNEPIPPAFDTDQYLEPSYQAAIREVSEEVNVDDTFIFDLLGFYDSVDRDPRGYTVSHVYVARTKQEPKAGSDAKNIVLVNKKEIHNFVENNDFAFDHKEILKDYIKKYA